MIKIIISAAFSVALYMFVIVPIFGKFVPYEEGSIFGTMVPSVLSIVVFIFCITCFFQMGKQEIKMANDVHTKAVAIEEAQMLELNKEYHDKTYKNDNAHYYYKSYKFKIDKAGKLGVYGRSKKALISRAYMVEWEVIDLSTNDVVQESKFHNNEVKMEDIKPGNYVLLFKSIDNELGMNLFKRKFKFKVIYE